LLDVNVLIALLDADHMHHHAARHWLAGNIDSGWASCPITENGCLRIMSQPGYPNALPVGAVAERLSRARSTSYHAFWPDSVSLLDTEIIVQKQICGPSQLTDVYLLALAVAQGGRLVSFDQRIALDCVVGAQPEHMLVIDSAGGRADSTA